MYGIVYEYSVQGERRVERRERREVGRSRESSKVKKNKVEGEKARGVDTVDSGGGEKTKII